jgi:hypothetical protein
MALAVVAQQELAAGESAWKEKGQYGTGLRTMSGSGMNTSSGFRGI